MVEIDAILTGALLHEKRKELRLSAEGLANVLNVSENSVRVWECGMRIPRLKYFIQLADLYKCKIDDLIVLK